MSTEDGDRRAPRTLPGATILQIVSSLADDNTGRATVDAALALLRSGACAIVAGADGPLVSELQGFGGEWITLAAPSRNPLTARGNVRVLEEFVSTERVDVVHARGINAALTAAAVTARTGSWLVNSYAGTVGARSWHDQRSRTRARPENSGRHHRLHSATDAEHLVARHAAFTRAVSASSRGASTSSSSIPRRSIRRE